MAPSGRDSGVIVEFSDVANMSLQDLMRHRELGGTASFGSRAADNTISPFTSYTGEPNVKGSNVRAPGS